MNSNYEVKINKNKPIQISPSDVYDSDIVEISDSFFHIIRNGLSILSECRFVNLESKTVHLVHEGKSFHISIRDNLDLLIEKMGMNASIKKKDGKVLAPMPGLILDVLVKKDEGILEGQSIAIIEAMKMENIIKSPFSGTVNEVSIKKGDIIDKSQVIVDIIATDI